MSWTNVNYNAGDFTALGANWIVDSGDVATLKYKLNSGGDKMTLAALINTTKVDADTLLLKLKLPAGKKSVGAPQLFKGQAWNNDIDRDCCICAQTNSQWLEISLGFFGTCPNWVADPDCDIRLGFTISVEVADV